MTAIVTVVRSTARLGDAPEWEIAVGQFSSGRYYEGSVPPAKDVPPDILEAIIQWAETGIPK